MQSARLAGLFQFHKGTIKTVERYRPSYEHLHFNSIKVQLKQQIDHKIDKQIAISIP